MGARSAMVALLVDFGVLVIDPNLISKKMVKKEKIYLQVVTNNEFNLEGKYQIEIQFLEIK